MILAGPGGGTVAADDDFGFDVLPDGTPPFTYQWYYNEGPLLGETNPILQLHRVTTAQTGYYSVLVSNAVGGVMSGLAYLSVTDPAIRRQPKDATVVGGTPFTNMVVGGGTPPLSYQWYFNGILLDSQTQSRLILPNVTEAQEGYYSVLVSNAIGTAWSDSKYLTVYDPLVDYLIFVSTAAGGQTLTNTVIARGSQPLSYQWYFNGLPLPGQTSTNLILTNVTEKQEGSYSVLVTNSSGSVWSSTDYLTINDPWIRRQPESREVVAGGTYTTAVLAEGTPPLLYQWYFNGLVLPGQTSDILVFDSVTKTNAGTYSVLVSNAVATVRSESVTLTVRDPVILVQPRGGAVNAGTDFAFVVVADGMPPFVYQWYFNGAPFPNTLVTNDQSTNTLALINVAQNQSGIYSVQVRNGSGSVMSAPASLTVYELAILTPPVSAWAVGGENFTNTVQAAGAQPLTYQWYHEGAALPSQTAKTLILSEVTTAESGRYTVRVGNRSGTVLSAPGQLVVFDPVIFKQPEGGQAAAGTDFLFTVVAGGIPPFSYQWYANGTALAGRTDISLWLTNLTDAQSGAYSVVVTNAAGSLTSSTANLVVADPAILLQPKGGQVAAGRDFLFRVLAGGTSPFTHQWSRNGVALAEATNATLLLTNVTATQTGTYSVVVGNSLGSVTSVPAHLAVSDPAIVLQPRGGWAAEGENFRFEVVAAGNKPIIYQWFFNYAELPGQVHPVLELADVTLSQSGLYYVEVRNTEGILTSSNVNLLITTNAPRTVFNGDFTAGTAGQAQLEILLQGNGLEHAFSFSLGFNTHVLTNPRFSPTSNAVASLDTSRLTNGLVGVDVQLPSGTTFLRTNQQLVGTFEFDVAPGANPLLGGIFFTGFPVPKAATSADGQPLILASAERPSVTLLQPEPQPNPLSGLFTQRLLVSNPTLLAFLGNSNVVLSTYDLGTDSLGQTILLYNAQGTGTIDADQDSLSIKLTNSVQVNLPLGEARRVTMEYYVPDHATVPRPNYISYFATLPGLVPPAPYFDTYVAVRAARYVDGEFLIEFPTQTGFIYYIQYANTLEDLANRATVQTSFPPVPGTGTVVQWIDNGPPKTESAPLDKMRFYQVLAIDY